MSSVRIIRAACLETSLPLSIATPMSACFRRGCCDRVVVLLRTGAVTDYPGATRCLTATDVKI